MSINLPFVLDIVVGVLFIYLTLSLLASELQELLTTLLQWRAKHLRQAIETMLAGESKPELGQSPTEIQAVNEQIQRSKDLAANLYDHALIRSMNQEAKGILGRLGQAVSRLTQTSQFFAGKSSGPSYLPSETFATTLLETLKVQDLIQKLSELKLEQFVSRQLLGAIHNVVVELRTGKANDALLVQELQELGASLQEVIQKFRNREVPLSGSLNQAVGGVRRFVAAANAILSQDDSLCNICLRRLSAIEASLPDLQQASSPTVMEVIAELDRMGWVASLLTSSSDNPNAILAQLSDESLQQRFQAGYEMLQLMTGDSAQERQPYQTVLTNLSPYLRENLYTLARRAQLKGPTNDLEQDVLQFQQEVALWFDRSMDRASGVYKRNAKAVAIVLGCLLAIVTNTDTLHMVTRMAKDPTLRATYSQVASELVSTNPNALSCLTSQIDQLTQGQCLTIEGVNVDTLRQAIEQTTNLPIGWSSINWQEQWQPSLQGSVLNAVKLFVGWLVSGIAISMGAPFWFNLLNKVLNVRSSGNLPARQSDNPANQ